jgi:hypothetical protein
MTLTDRLAALKILLDAHEEKRRAQKRAYDAERPERQAVAQRAAERRRPLPIDETTFDIEAYFSRARRAEKGRVGLRPACAYVSQRVRDMLKRRSGGACERCKRDFKNVGGRGFTVHHDAENPVEKDGVKLGHLRAWCRTCNTFEEIGDDAIPQFDRSPRAPPPA